MYPVETTSNHRTLRALKILGTSFGTMDLLTPKALCSLLAKGNHLSAASWRSWHRESITEANQEDCSGLLDERQSSSQPHPYITLLLTSTTVECGLRHPGNPPFGRRTPHDQGDSHPIQTMWNLPQGYPLGGPLNRK